MKQPLKGPRTAWAAHWALLPMGATVLIAYVASILWTVRISLSNSKMLPRADWAGMTQYVNLFSSDRWTTAMIKVNVKP